MSTNRHFHYLPINYFWFMLFVAVNRWYWRQLRQRYGDIIEEYNNFDSTFNKFNFKLRKRSELRKLADNQFNEFQGWILHLSKGNITRLSISKKVLWTKRSIKRTCPKTVQFYFGQEKRCAFLYSKCPNYEDWFAGLDE